MEAVPAFNRGEISRLLRDLAVRGISIGTSSWKYPGWIGPVYERERYLAGDRFSQRRFAEACLAEYAAIFPTVCVDASYYRFPDTESIARLCGQVPEGFHFSFKVTEEVTAVRFPHLARHRGRAGKRNPGFLDAERFKNYFLRALEPHAEQVGLLIFEFSRFSRADFRVGREFIEQLDRFLGCLPGGWRYGVEIRNRSLLRSEYFEVLRCHGVAHVFNSWQRMPGVGEQVALRESRTAQFFGARLLLKPGRGYAEAVDAFSPYDRVREELPEVRDAMAALIGEVLAGSPHRSAAGQERGVIRSASEQSFIYVNNRLEGSSPATIAGILARLDAMA